MPRESEFTAARPDCPHPQRWHASTAGETEHEVTELLAGLVRALQPEHVVETGSLYGSTSQAIGVALLRNGHGRLTAVESDEQWGWTAARRCGGLPVDVHIGSSLAYTPDRSVDLLFSDSGIDVRGAEIRWLSPHLHPASVIVVHDTGPQHPVRGQLDELVASGLIRPPLYLPTPRGVAITALA